MFPGAMHRLRHPPPENGAPVLRGRPTPPFPGRQAPDAALEPADVIKAADTALYEAKDAGRNAIAVAAGPA